MTSRRNKLNAKQIQLLKLIYKFRFVTESLVARHKGLSNVSIHYSFTVLLDQELIGRRYTSNDKIAGKSAAYYLTPKTLRLLRDSFDLDEKVVHAMYKNKTVGRPFIDQQLAIMETYLSLRDTYPDIFNIFTASELGRFDYFPDPKPNLYLSRIEPTEGLPDDYMLDIINDNRKFLIKKRIDIYAEHFESGDWGEGEYPTLLLVCPDTGTETRVLKHVESLLEDFDIYVTTTKALTNSNRQNNTIWSEAVEPEKLYSLN